MSLNRYELKFKELYLNEKYEINSSSEQNIILHNRGTSPNLPRQHRHLLQMAVLGNRVHPIQVRSPVRDHPAETETEHKFQLQPFEGPSHRPYFQVRGGGIRFPLGN